MIKEAVMKINKISIQTPNIHFGKRKKEEKFNNYEYKKRKYDTTPYIDCNRWALY